MEALEKGQHMELVFFGAELAQKMPGLAGHFVWAEQKCWCNYGDVVKLVEDKLEAGENFDIKFRQATDAEQKRAQGMFAVYDLAGSLMRSYAEAVDQVLDQYPEDAQAELTRMRGTFEEMASMDGPQVNFPEALLDKGKVPATNEDTE